MRKHKVHGITWQWMNVRVVCLCVTQSSVCIKAKVGPTEVREERTEEGLVGWRHSLCKAFISLISACGGSQLPNRYIMSFACVVNCMLLLRLLLLLLLLQ